MRPKGAAMSTLNQPPLLASFSMPTFASTQNMSAAEARPIRRSVLPKSKIKEEWLSRRNPKYLSMDKGPWGTLKPESRYTNQHSLRWNEKGEQRVGEEPLVLEKKISQVNLRTKMRARADMDAALRRRTSLFLPYPTCAKDLGFQREERKRHFMGGETVERFRIVLEQHGRFSLTFEVVEDPLTGSTKRCTYEGIFGPLGFKAGHKEGDVELNPTAMGTLVNHLELQCFMFEQIEARWDPTAGYRSAEPRPAEELDVPANVERCNTRFKITLMPPADPQEAELSPLTDPKPAQWPAPNGDSQVTLHAHNLGPRAIEHAHAYHGWHPVVMQRLRGHCWAYPEANTAAIGGLWSSKGGLSRSMAPGDFISGARSPKRAQDGFNSPGLHSAWASRTQR